MLTLFLALSLTVSAVNSKHRILLPAIQGSRPSPPYALQFDGLDDFVSIAGLGEFDFDQAFTIEAWVKPLSIQPYDGTVEDIALVWAAQSEPPVPWYDERGWGFTPDSPPSWSKEYFNPTLLRGPECHDVAMLSFLDRPWRPVTGTTLLVLTDTGEIRSYRDGELQCRS